jgi:hypothetical protein
MFWSLPEPKPEKSSMLQWRPKSSNFIESQEASMKSTPKDDRLIPLTRIAFTPLAIFTTIFGPLLYFLPGRTAQYWAWEINPEMSAAWVGAGYTFGALAIWTILILGRFQKLFVPIMATWALSTVMLIATILHIDRFFIDRIQFWIWFIIYLALPFALPVTWWLNKRRAIPPQENDLLFPKQMTLIAPVISALFYLLAFILLFNPGFAASFWPWQLTPLMSRVISGWLMFIATGALCLLFERRYSVYREFIPQAGIWFALILLAGWRHANNFDFGRPAAYIFFGMFIILVPLMFGLFFLFERQRRAAIHS